MKRQTVERLGIAWIVACAFTFALVYFGTIIQGQTSVIMDLNHYGEAIIEFPLLLALFPFGIVQGYYMIKN